MENQSRTLFIVVGALVLIVLVGLVGYYAVKVRTAVVPEGFEKEDARKGFVETPQEFGLEGPEWKIYENKKLGFSFSYPPTWEVAEHSEEPKLNRVYLDNYAGKVGRFTIENLPSDYQQFFISAEQDESSENSENAIRTYSNSVQNSKVSNLNGLDINLYILEEAEGGPTARAFWSYGQNRYSAVVPSGSVGSAQELKSVTEIMKNVLSTFQFTK